MAVAPAAIERLWSDIHAAIPSAVLSGIVGDVNHSFGYHLARNELPGSDYSVTLPPDRLGSSLNASALDVKLSTDLMKIVTRRLTTAAQARDPRLRALREFCGTLDGNRTWPWDLVTNASEGIGTWDSSHLWHIHFSFFREYADNYTALAPIAQVVAGIPLEDDLTPEQSKQLAAVYDILCNGASPLNAFLHRMESDIIADKKTDTADAAVDAAVAAKVGA